MLLKHPMKSLAADELKTEIAAKRAKKSGNDETVHSSHSAKQRKVIHSLLTFGLLLFEPILHDERVVRWILRVGRH